MALAEFSARGHLGMEFVVITEEKALPNPDLAARAHQALPLVGMLLQLACEQDLDVSAQKVSRGWVVWTERLGLKTCPPSIEASGKNARVVEDEEIVRTK